MSDILTTIGAGIMTITLNRAGNKNAITSAMYASMADALQQAANDEAIRAALLQGHETVFCAGNDIGDRGVIARLAAQPPAIAESKVAAKSKIGVRRNSALPGDDVANALRRYADVFRQPVLREPKRLEEFFFEHFAWRHRE